MDEVQLRAAAEKLEVPIDDTMVRVIDEIFVRSVRDY